MTFSGCTISNCVIIAKWTRGGTPGHFVSPVKDGTEVGNRIVDCQRVRVGQGLRGCSGRLRSRSRYMSPVPPPEARATVYGCRGRVDRLVLAMYGMASSSRPAPRGRFVRRWPTARRGPRHGRSRSASESLASTSACGAVTRPGSFGHEGRVIAPRLGQPAKRPRSEAHPNNLSFRQEGRVAGLLPPQTSCPRLGLGRRLVRQALPRDSPCQTT